MNISINLIMALSLCVLSGDFDGNGTVDFKDFVIFADNWLKVVDDGGEPADPNDANKVTIALTRLDVNDLALDVNDQTLELRWTIKNRSDHDVWICDSVGFIEDEFEVYLGEDDETLLIRRCLDVPALVIYYIWPEGRYVRLRSGKEQVKSLSITLPVHHHWMFIPRLEKQGVIYARRLVLEIGYHTKDLAQMILEFQGSNEDPNIFEKATISYLSLLNEGENVLRITVDGVYIPYEDMWDMLAQDPHAKVKAEKQAKTREGEQRRKPKT